MAELSKDKERDLKNVMAMIEKDIAKGAIMRMGEMNLEEIRGMIGVLRAGDPAAETEPTAGTERLDDLAAYLRRAGLLYGWGLRHLILVAPMLGFIVHPLAGPVAAVLVVLALWGFDRLVPGR